MAEVIGTEVDVTQFEQQPPSDHASYTRMLERLKAWDEVQAEEEQEETEDDDD